MSRWATAATLLTAAVLLGGGGCETSAVAVEDCRDVERARCRAAQNCDLGIDTDDEVHDCELYARDHCLHGLAVEDDPSAKDIRACVAAIEAAGSCAANGGPDTTATACGTKLNLNRTDITACELVIAPEELPACQFLSPDTTSDKTPPSPEPDASTTPPPTDAGGDG